MNPGSRDANLYCDRFVHIAPAFRGGMGGQGSRNPESRDLQLAPGKETVSSFPADPELMSGETKRDRHFFLSSLAGEQKRRGNILADKIRSKSRIPHSEKQMPTPRQACVATHLGSRAHTGRGFYHQSASASGKEPS